MVLRELSVVARVPFGSKSNCNDRPSLPRRRSSASLCSPTGSGAQDTFSVNSDPLNVACSVPEIKRFRNCSYDAAEGGVSLAMSPLYISTSPRPSDRHPHFDVESFNRDTHHAGISGRVSRSRGNSGSNSTALNERTPLIGHNPGRAGSACCVQMHDQATDDDTITAATTFSGNRKNSNSIEESASESEYEQNAVDHSARWTYWRLLKTIVLSLVVVYTLATFILIPEKHEHWLNVAVHKGEPVYLNLTNNLDIINPVWTVKAKSAFLPHEYDNFSDYDVSFAIVRFKQGIEVGRFKKVWVVPVASAQMSQLIPLKEVQHSFIMPGVLGGNDIDYDPSDEFTDDLFDEDSSYRLEIVTNDDYAVPISLCVTAFSDLSLRGVLMAGAVLVFMYVLIIFEVVHRTLAAMIGAVAAISCLTIIHDRPSIERVAAWVDSETLSLLFGMMIMVAVLCETGFFDYVAVLAFRLARGQTTRMVIILCLFTGLLSAFLDNVTTILLMTPVTIRLCEIKNIDPKHVLIAQVIFSNIGGAATPVGDPPNVIIINSRKVKDLGIDFTTFTLHLLPGILVCTVAAIFYILFIYRDLSKLSFQKPPNQVGKKRLMEYLRDEVDILDSMERNPRPSENRSERSKQGSRYHENISMNPSQTSPPSAKPSVASTTSPDTVFEASASPPTSAELKNEIDVWTKACNSIPGYSRDENSVRTVLKRKVMALENVLRKHLYDDKHQEDDFVQILVMLKKKYRIKNKPLLLKSGIVLTIVILLFFLQGLPSMDISLGWIAILGAVALLTLCDSDELDVIINRVEWSTLIFFAALFIVMEVLEELRFLWWIGQLTQSAINSFSDEHRLLAAIVIILWVSALSSSLIDNIPFATVMIKIVEDLAESESVNLPITPLVYALAFGACLGGNGTLIGASANVVCAGVAEQHGYKFTFLDFFKVGFPIMLLTTVIANIYLVVCHVMFTWN